MKVGLPYRNQVTTFFYIKIKLSQFLVLIKLQLFSKIKTNPEKKERRMNRCKMAYFPIQILF